MESSTINNIDGFRLINSLHTTARQLTICSEIIRSIAGKQLPKQILFQLMLNWSINEELNNDIYKNSKGKLSEKGKQTTAFKNYLDLCISLKLITHLNDIYSCSRLSFILLYFLESSNKKVLSLAEKIFYLFQLLWIDSDGILFILDEIKASKVNQRDLQINFKNNFNKRLLIKQEFSNPIVKNKVSERYRTINFIWKKPEKYSEHLLIPRCEWLSSLGILEIKKQGNFTTYETTEEGRLFISKIPFLANSILTDINEEWFFNNYFSSAQVLYRKNNMIIFKEMDEKTKESEIVTGLIKALKVVKTSNSVKIPLYDSLIFLCIDFFCNRNILIEVSEVLTLLNNGVTNGLRSFNLKYDGRLNESYIISKVI